MNNNFQLMQAMMNPQQFIQNMARNPKFASNPLLKNVIEMSNKGDYSGIEQIARNICKERNIDPDSAYNQIKNQFGIK